MTNIFLVVLFILPFAIVSSLPLNSIDNNKQLENDPMYGSHYEGDMILDEDQLKAVSSPARNGLILEKYRWPNNTVPYQLSSDHTQKQQDHIELALRTIESISCLKFVRRTDEVDYVALNAGDGGCYSQVGRKGGAQELNLKKFEPGKGCFRIATIIHEFLHALGFYHMQSAYDRDDYVTIAWDNITPGLEHNFNKYTNLQVTHFNTTYDYYSVMHYGPDAFSKNGQPTIVANDEEYNKVIGMHLGLSEKDILKLNRMYECDGDAATIQES